MSRAGVAEIELVLPPLLRALDALSFAARYFHPPQLAELLAAIGRPDLALREARAGLPPWSDPLSALGVQLDGACDAAVAGLERLAAAAEADEPLGAASRALRMLPRALEALYPLAGVLPPVNRYFLNAARQSDAGYQQGFMRPPPENTGLMHLSEDADARGAVWLYVPETLASSGRPAPLIMALHGGGGHGRGFLWTWLREARSRGAVLVAPASLGRTWALSGPDPDTPRLAALLEAVRADWPIDPRRMLLTGMSDGGTFAYTSGLEPTSPFTHLAPVAAAFHPMLAEMADAGRIAGLPVFITHGALDWMFPARMAQQAAAALAGGGAAVTHRELADLSHAYPSEINGDILDWLDATARV